MEEIIEEDVIDFLLPTPKVSDPDESTSYKPPADRDNALNALKLKFEDDDSDVNDLSFDMSMDLI